MAHVVFMTCVMYYKYMGTVSGGYIVSGIGILFYMWCQSIRLCGTPPTGIILGSQQSGDKRTYQDSWHKRRTQDYVPGTSWMSWIVCVEFHFEANDIIDMKK